MSFEPEHLNRWTMPKDYFGASRPEYYGSGCGQTRDSDALERSNFRSMLKKLGGESETVIVVRENHWACGWVEWIAIHQDDEKSLAIADEIKGRLENYPVVCESDFSDLETEEANQVWKDCYGPHERLDYIRAHPFQFEFRDFADMLSCARGNYFAGYASELLN